MRRLSGILSSLTNYQFPESYMRNVTVVLPHLFIVLSIHNVFLPPFVVWDSIRY